MTEFNLDEDLARRVLGVVDAGLVSGVGSPEPGKMCVEAAVCYAMGLPHGDNPTCVSPAVRSLKIRLNDSDWSSPGARARGMRRLAIAQLGTADVLNDQEFAKRCSELAIRVSVPAALRAAAALFPKTSEHKEKLLEAADLCEREGSESAAVSAAVSAARSAAVSAVSAAWSAARSAAVSAESAARSAAVSAARSAAESAAVSAAWSAARSAAVSAESAESAARDESLAKFAESIVRVLIKLEAPGTKYLHLAPL